MFACLVCDLPLVKAVSYSHHQISFASGIPQGYSTYLRPQASPEQAEIAHGAAQSGGLPFRIGVLPSENSSQQAYLLQLLIRHHPGPALHHHGKI